MILHIDMDAFYASVEERERPELAGKPVVVGGTPEGRGVVAAANYVARKFGVHSGMPAATAKRLCPHAVFLPSRLSYYAEVSEQIRGIFLRYTPLVEPLSLDEAFLDVTASESLFGPSVEIGREIKSAIRHDLGLIASVGVAPNKFLAKIASDLEKPDGFVVVPPDRVQAFLDPLPVRRLWGVGRVTGNALEQLGVRTIGQVRELGLDILEQQFGRHGKHLWELSRCIDERQVVPDREAKSISQETTFAHDIDDSEVLRAWLRELTEQVARRLRHQGLRGHTVHLKVRFSDFRTITRTTSLANATNVTQEIWRAVDAMLSQRLPAQHLSVRLLGLGVSAFDHCEQKQRFLFDDKEQTTQVSLDMTTDDIRERFGASSLSRASSLLYNVKHRSTPE